MSNLLNIDDYVSAEDRPLLNSYLVAHTGQGEVVRSPQFVVNISSYDFLDAERKTQVSGLTITTTSGVYNETETSRGIPVNNYSLTVSNPKSKLLAFPEPPFLAVAEFALKNGKLRLSALYIMDDVIAGLRKELTDASGSPSAPAATPRRGRAVRDIVDASGEGGKG